MNIIVPIKQVPDTGVSLQIKNKQLEESSIKWSLSPYDEFALESAGQLKNQLGGQVFALSLGPQRAKEALLTALALGADQAIHLLRDSVPADPLFVAETLRDSIKKIPDVSLIFCGKLSSDFGHFAVPQMLAQLLDWPFVSNVNHLDYKESIFTLKRECGSGVEELLQAKVPLVLSADKGLNQPRYPSLPGIMKAKKKPFRVEKVEGQPRFEIQQLSPPPDKSTAQIIEGTPEEQVAELVKILKEKEKLL